VGAIVLDKSFLQGSKKAQIHDLAQKHRLLMSDTLFYELLTGGEPARSRCFAKLPPVPNPVDLVDHVGTLMRKEIETHCPAGKPSENCIQLKFQFNPRLVTPEYELPKEALISVEEQTVKIGARVKQLIGRVSLVDTFFPNLLSGNDSKRTQERIDAEQAIAEPGALLPFYANLEAPPGEKPFPPSSLVTEEWAVYRWLQVQFMFALDIYVRFQGVVPEDLTPLMYEKIEHDVLDAEVMMLACLEGALATREKKLVRWWNLLCPSGTLYQ